MAVATMTRATQPRRSPALAGLAAAAAAALLLVYSMGSSPADAGVPAFVGGLAPVHRPMAPRVRMRAGDVVDAEVVDVEEAGEEVTSVFDGQKKAFFRAKFNGEVYRVYRGNWIWEQRKEDGTIVSGKWARGFNMPEEEFEKRRPQLLQKYRAKKRKLRIKHGKGQKYPNGQYIFLTKLSGSPFTRELYGEKYAGRKEWLLHPNEVPSRERHMRALELKRKMMQEAEEKRLDRLKDLGVWPGEEAWRKPWEAKPERVVTPGSNVPL
mmetsp:Transcript_22087/g.56346  ORF Transcript_22087/g.56346 Transcript_22087/m.56346 type:complete len:266 (-) Transcript_22087:230-1027(-)